MYITIQQDLLKDLANRIEEESTGTPEALADRLGVTHKMLRRCITHLRAMGADIGYCTARNTYYFVKPLRFKFGFNPLETSKNQ